MWTEMELSLAHERKRTHAEKYKRETGFPHPCEKTAELYRLALLGLAAEQVGRDVLAKHGEDVVVTAKEQRAMDAFVLHPAWGNNG